MEKQNKRGTKSGKKNRRVQKIRGGWGGGRGVEVEADRTTCVEKIS